MICYNCMKTFPQLNSKERCPCCGYINDSTFSGDDVIIPGTILHGRYIVGTTIRVRQSDVIYHGYDYLFSKKVRIQEYYPRDLASRNEKQEICAEHFQEDRYRQGLEQFIYKSKNLIRLYKEEDICTYDACFPENNTAYAIVDETDMRTLSDVLAEKKFTLQEAKSLLIRMSECLEKCDGIDLHHGEIDSSTFWYAGGDRLILKDFGTKNYTGGGTGNLGQKKDLFGISKVFLEILSGQQFSEKLDIEDLLRMCPSHLDHKMKAFLRIACSGEIDDFSQFDRELRYATGMRNKRTGSKKESRRRNEGPFWEDDNRLLYLCIALAVGILVTGLTVSGAFFINRKNSMNDPTPVQTEETLKATPSEVIESAAEDKGNTNV